MRWRRSKCHDTILLHRASVGTGMPNPRCPASATPIVGSNLQVLTNVKESKLQHTEQPQLFLSMHIAQYQLAQGQNAETKPALEEAKEKLASLNDVRLTSQCSYHKPPDFLTQCMAHIGALGALGAGLRNPELDAESVSAWTVPHGQHTSLCSLDELPMRTNT